MASMNTSLPDPLKAELDTRVSEGGYGTHSEYVRELIRDDLAAQRFRRMILEGGDSPIEGEMDKAWFDELRARVKARGARTE
jgi:antitoxin ParD1/3/4